MIERNSRAWRGYGSAVFLDRAFFSHCHRLTFCSAIPNLTHRRDRGPAAPMDGGRAGGREPFRGRGAYLPVASRSTDIVRSVWTRPREQLRFVMAGVVDDSHISRLFSWVLQHCNDFID